LLGARNTARGRAARATLCGQNPEWEARLELLEIDVSATQSVTAAREVVRERYGADATPLHGIVNNAGIGFGSDDMAGIVNVNTIGVKRVCDAFLPLVVPGGRVVNVSSASGPKFVSQCAPQRQLFFKDARLKWADIEQLIDDVVAHAGDAGYLRSLGLGECSPYGFSKACTSLYTLLLARDNPQLLVNACTPGFIETDLTRPQAEQQGVSPRELGMMPPELGTVPILFLLFGQVPDSGRYYGSDAKRSPLDRYRAPGSPEYRGE
jgi:NAD(P)-dependent dehydrogenase (short-subunit alcohol dehydrogenase family)